jgi:hypothetical protein
MVLYLVRDVLFMLPAGNDPFFVPSSVCFSIQSENRAFKPHCNIDQKGMQPPVLPGRYVHTAAASSEFSHTLAWCLVGSAGTQLSKNKLRGLSPSASELYRPSSHLLSAKLVPTFANRGCRVVSVTDSYGSILVFLDRSRYFFFQVAPQLYSRGWMDLVPDPLLLRKSCCAGNRTRTSGSVARNSDN